MASKTKLTGGLNVIFVPFSLGCAWACLTVAAAVVVVAVEGSHPHRQESSQTGILTDRNPHRQDPHSRILTDRILTAGSSQTGLTDRPHCQLLTPVSSPSHPSPGYSSVWPTGHLDKHVASLATLHCLQQASTLHCLQKASTIHLHKASLPTLSTPGVTLDCSSTGLFT